MDICGDSGAFDFGDACVRSSWSAILPLLVVLGLCISSLQIPFRLPSAIQRLSAAAKVPFATYITLHEAEAVDLQSARGIPNEGAQIDIDVPEVVPLWRSLFFVFAGLIQSLAWLASGVFYFVTNGSVDVWNTVQCLLIAVSWLYTVARPIAAPFATAPYDLFVLYVMHAVGGILILGGHLFAYAVGDEVASSTLILVGLGVNLAVVFALLYVTVRMPMNVPSTRVKKEEIGHTVSPEDYTKLWSWITFNWVYPLVKRGRNATLNEKDVWGLSPTMQSRPIFVKFQGIQRPTLFRRLVAASSLDIILDFAGAILVIVFQYGVPFFMKRLLDTIDQRAPTPRDHGMAYVYAGLMFLCSVLKAQCDLQHLWFCRRACTRVRSELMAAIYEKALKRKDFSGIVNHDEKDKTDKTDSDEGNGAPATKDDNSKNKDKAKTRVDKDKAKADEQKADDPKPGADTAKIINLMSGDAEQIWFICSILYFLYGAPFEIVIGSVLLYQLLGWSAFSGFAVFLACWPLNSWIANRTSGKPEIPKWQ